jgi:chromosome partitioning protein
VDQCRRRAADRLDFVPSHIDLAAAEMELISIVGREVILRDALGPCEADYDFVFMDCPPSLGVLTLNGLCAATEVFIPLQGHFLALQGLGKLLETVRLVADRINPQLSVTGVLLCMYDSGTRLAAEVVEDLRSFLASSRSEDVPWKDAVIFETVIRRNIRLAECPSHGKTIFDYEPNCHGAKDYDALAGEILGRTAEGDVADSSGANTSHRDGDVQSTSQADGAAVDSPDESSHKVTFSG